MHIVRPGTERVHALATSRDGRPVACPVALYLDGLAPSGRRAIAMALDQFAAVVTDGQHRAATELDWSKIGYAETARARAVWGQRYSPGGIRIRMAAVKGCVRTAWRLGLIDAEQYQRAIDVPVVRGKTLPTGRALSEAELDSLLGACAGDPTPLGRRDAALFAIFRVGLRTAEVMALQLADYTPSHGDEPAELRVHGKGNKGRYAYLPAAAAALVDAWIAVRGHAAGPLVCALRRSHRVDASPRPLKHSGIAMVCNGRAEQAGVTRFMRHDFRRTTATELQANGEHLSVIRDVLGHQSVSTTEKYLRNDRELAKRRATTRLRVPTVAAPTPPPETE